MPEFYLEESHTAEYKALPEFVQGYIECIFFTNASCFPMTEFWSAESQEAIREGRADGDLPSDAGFFDLHPSALALIQRDCGQFQRDAAHLLAQAYVTTDYEEAQAGRDFWFTRCGHGVGFWAREALEVPAMGPLGGGSLGDRLTALAKVFGEQWVSFEPDATSATGHGSVYIS